MIKLVQSRCLIKHGKLGELCTSVEPEKAVFVWSGTIKPGEGIILIR
jgi:hypothetical protein